MTPSVIDGVGLLDSRNKVSHVNPTQDDESSLFSAGSDAGISVDTVFTPRPEDEDGSSESSSRSSSDEHPYSLQEDWNKLESYFAERDKTFDTITAGKSEAFKRILHEREMEVRSLERELLLLRRLGEEGACTRSHASRSTDRKKPFNLQAFLRRCHDCLVFEWNITVSAIYSLVVHSAAHLAIYELINLGLDETRKCLNSIGAQNYEKYICLALLISGSICLRLSGYLYWWLNDQDYDCLKFDYHNRLRTKKWDARILHWIRGNDVLRCLLYTVGYNLSYFAVIYVFEQLQHYVDQKEALLAHLPSYTFARADEYESSDFKAADSECDDEHAIGVMERLYNWTLIDMDLVFTRKTMSGNSFDMFWHQYINRISMDEGASLTTPLRDLLFCLGVITTSMVLLSRYGFMWQMKY